ncbi:MAG: DUF4386 domain-containing protein [Cyanobacteriota bacterium]
MLRLRRWTGALCVGISLLANLPFLRLMSIFDYDDILREPPAVVLSQFAAGGSQLIWTWWAFAAVALVFVPTGILLATVLRREDTPYLETVGVLGALSGLLQAVGLLRWVFVIPPLARAFVEADAGERSTLATVYGAVHQYGGVLIGEHLGQLLLVGWTIGIAVAVLGSSGLPSWLGWLGLTTVPFWLLGQTEMLATGIPELPVLELGPVAFMLWEVWLLLLGLWLWRSPIREGSSAKFESRSAEQ